MTDLSLIIAILNPICYNYNKKREEYNNIMKAKKVFKRIFKAILIFFGLLLVCIIIMFVNRQIHLKTDIEYLKSKGYYNPVSVGSYSLNLLDFGKKDGKHTIIAMAGYGIPDTCITMRKMTLSLEEENRVIFLDRAGYGASGDTKNEMTAEYIVEDYRKALENAGINAPYVLMAHSIGGVYATYWESKSPEEIEAVVYIDTTEMRSFDLSDNRNVDDVSYEKLLLKLDRMGIGHIALRAFLPKNSDYSKEEQRIEDIMSLMTADSDALVSEGKNKLVNTTNVWDMIVTNDISKLYINSSNAFQTKEEVLENGGLDDKLIHNLTEPYFSGSEEERAEEAYEIYLDERKYVREHILQPYFEKLGNCEMTLLPGEHLIYQQKPDECSMIIKNFLDATVE